MSIILDLQLAYDTEDDVRASIPAFEEFEKWGNAVLAHLALNEQEITIRIVNNEESQNLNAEYRNKDKPTNVLSFPFECPPGIDLPLLGDLVIAASVIKTEAAEQCKTVSNHYAHMVVHGLLHLLGYDHIDEQDAEEMEAIEIHILKQLEIDDPYQDHLG